MEKNEYKRHFELEPDFWWFTGRRHIILSTLRTFDLLDSPLRHLDIGCGTGYDLKVFSRLFDSSGCDLVEDALQFCRQREIKSLVRSDAKHLPFLPESFDLVTLFDVLYHREIGDDVSVMAAVYRILKPGGHILITDAAFNFLFSRHDRAFHARERYHRKTLRRRLEACGFRIEKITYFNFFLFPVVVLVRLLEKRHSPGDPESNLKPVPRWLNTFFHHLLKVEALLLKRIDLPFGSSILCLAKKESP